MNITIKDIAAIAGVSYSTVSKALNNSSLVKEDTKRRIIELSKDMGYEPNFAAQRLVSKNTKVIGLIWPTIERTVLATLVTKISNEMAKTLYSMILSVDSIQKSMETFKKFQVDGIILFEENIYTEINPNTIPMISYGVSGERNSHYPIIDANHSQAMDDAIHYLYELGHREIIYIGNISPIDPLQMEKFEGFKNAMKKYGITYNNDNIINTGGLDWYHGYQAVDEVLNRKALPTAIIGGSYEISGGIIRCLKQNNVHIPGEISVISYDNIPQMAHLEIPLTCIGVSVEDLAVEIVYSAIKLIETSNVNTEIKKLTPTLVERKSCAPVKK
ncbi:LacI family DNA-binding transcriptional regulator [Aquibacillus saliphilus]|uniref:LacI family DNA-binding transcriptional regulator n=1 Tax=Aquibacillus saliphilus TaxID=1909422 RepID=UPI001CF0708E|nr:LacI family DNA-binding transcriptional regulator [Aquibacillus saliphilus]